MTRLNEMAEVDAGKHSNLADLETRFRILVLTDSSS
jgi:hypothetical protein